MLLCVDIGNTNTVLAVFEGETLKHSWRIRTDPHATADELGLTFRALLDGDGVDLSGIALSSTVPQQGAEVAKMVQRYYPHAHLVQIAPGIKTGVRLSIDNPREAGPDRIANTHAAFHLYGGPCITVDFGTSTNIDVISATGDFLGGAFAPGIEISIDALASRAANLLKIPLVKPRSVIGKNTVECLQSGMVYGTAAQVDGLVRRITEELGTTPTAVVATGGLAPVVIEQCETVTHYEPNLTLHGLRMIWDRNV
ncbi:MULTISPECIES: type III pantothenate kinase [Glycomyces]|uniref:Type III pantothenate kinase n=2 Tax=Glycomyces TaxID=58113 RepID=A0A9W6LFS7_9ACTN|nr:MULTISPECIES: type III pantothenate kinase [Glycomyces]MDA1368419.1 type III pantothenate kinase [Glycomyces algeriensis]MDN3241847.1 type III pantothenate kinase [Glycomyces tritici]MDN3243684.1 type III pantothenate kinase [Glycomyces tritici]MDR7353225.1 type III pantothenate kinase [Glycomyces algeriensis]GLI40919.1 type III pantothenate kinase [Glycomyces algeriensis]